MVQDEDPLDQDEDSWEEVDSEPDSQDEGEIKAREGVQLLEEEELLEALKSAKGKTNVKQARRAITKQQREHAAMLHRASVLCLAARLMLLDQAADDLLIQALVLSELEPQLVSMLNPRHEMQRAVNCLSPVLKWFRTHWDVCENSATEEPAPCRAGSRQRGQPSSSSDAPNLLAGQDVHAMVRAACTQHSGPAEALVVLFVSLVRAHGMLARVVRLIDGCPLRPWRKKAPALRTVSAPPATKEPAKAKEEKDNKASGSSKTKGGQVSTQTKGGAAKSKAKKDVVKDVMAGTSAAEQGKKRGSKGAGKGKQAARQPPGGAEGASNGGDASTQPVLGEEGSKRNKGDEEFELALRMAMQATAAEHEARQQAGVTATVSAFSNQASGKEGSPARSSSAGRAQSAAPALLRGARSSRGRLASGQGPHIAVNQVQVSMCWAEVWCGSAEYGRWVAVDVAGQQVDRAADVGAAASAAGGSVAAAGYVLACEHGAVRDVTQRYLTNTLALSQLRDVSWWASTVRRISNLRPRPPAYVQLGQAQPPPQHQQQPAPQAVASGQQGKAPAAAAQSQQPNGAVPQSTATPIVQASPSDAPPGSVAPQLVPAPARPPLPPAASAPAQAQHMSAADAAALRARREDMELSHSHRVGLAGLPTSVEGFKAHPTYVLKRHISTYQALRPGTAPLGMHKGEPYYPRAALSELHTADRWRREGWKVREEELSQPAKIVKKRALPPPPSNSLRSGAFWGSRRWGGQGARTGTLYGASSAPAQQLQGAPSLQSQASAASSADLEQEVTEEGAAAEEGAGGQGTEGEMNWLYGKWQCDPYIAKAEGGRVPKNDRGNVEVPPFAPALPVGCVHLIYPGLAAICRSLGIDYAPALEGFDRQGGRPVPKINGVVVCQEHEQLVTAAYLEKETARQEAARAKADREARYAWAQLLAALRKRMQLANDYGGGDAQDQNTTTAETEKKNQQAASKAGGRGRKRRGAADALDPADQGKAEEQRKHVMERLLKENYQDAAPSEGQGTEAAMQAPRQDMTAQAMETEEI